MTRKRYMKLWMANRKIGRNQAEIFARVARSRGSYAESIEQMIRTWECILGEREWEERK